jgi:hypothetical protein
MARLLTTLSLATLLTALGQATAQPGRETEYTVVLDNKFTAMGIPLPKDWKLASDFKNDKETSGFILRISHAAPIPIPKKQTFVGGPKFWNDVLVRYPFRLTYRAEGKTTEQSVAKGELRGEASPLKVTEIRVVDTRYELRLVKLDELAKEAAEKVVHEGGVSLQLRFNLIPMIATPDPGSVGGLLADVRKGKKDTNVVVPMKNRLPVRVTGALSCYLAKNQRFEFDLKPGESKSVAIPVDPADIKGRPSVNLWNLKLEPPGGK